MTLRSAGLLGAPLVAALIAAGAGFGAAVHAQTVPAPVAAPAQESAVSAADLSAAIDKLGAFDLAVRTAASRTARRADASLAVPALTRAAREHADGYVRYRALVLLAGFGDGSTAGTMRDLMDDKNDRLRMVAYAWFEDHRDAAVLPHLIDALSREESEFVRPALLRTVVAYGDDERARTAVMPLIARGDDLFRGAVIEALGDYRAAYAVAPLADIAKLEGPLQEDAVTALGKIGGQQALPVLADLQRSGPRAAQPAVAAALCMLASNCAANTEYLTKSLQFGAVSAGNESVLSGAAHGLAVLALHDHPEALGALFDAGVPAQDPARGPIGLAVGLIAMRDPGLMLAALEGRKDRDGAIELLRDAFDMLASEDYELERFYVDVRHAYWTAAPNSARRQVAEAVIQKLEF